MKSALHRRHSPRINSSVGEGESEFLVHAGQRLVHLSSDLKEVSVFVLPRNTEETHRLLGGHPSPATLQWARTTFSAHPDNGIFAGDPLSRNLVRRVGLKTLALSEESARAIKRDFFSAIPVQTLRDQAGAELRALVSSTEEQISVLSRECDRLERIMRRQDENSHYLDLASVPGTAVGEHVKRSTALRNSLSDLLAESQACMNGEVQKLLPSTTKLLGARTAGRLLAAAGSLRHLSRMNASQLQLLGSRRRSTGRTPKHGVIYLAEGMDRVSQERKGALARTLSSLGAVALRADTLTHADVGEYLLSKREARIKGIARERKGIHEGR